METDAREYPANEYVDRNRYEVKKDERRKEKRPEIHPLPAECFDLVELQRKSAAFIRERRWEAFHSPASVALAVSVKAGEIAESYQHRPRPIEQPAERRAWALADVFLNVFRMADLLRIPNLYTLIEAKLTEMEARFSSNAVIRRVGVFCGSGFGANPTYREAARAVGMLLARKKIGLVYGGTNVGLMGVVADAALEGGEVIGIITEHFVGAGIAHQNLADLRVVSSMANRNELMADLSDVFLALPGGVGTIAEFSEMVERTMLDEQQKACGVLDLGGYYDSILAPFNRGAADGFIKSNDLKQVVFHDSDPERLIDSLLSANVPHFNKWPRT